MEGVKKMRIRVRDWQRDWIRENGRTDELEVVIAESDGAEIYSGSFAGIPEYELGKKVMVSGRILDSTVPERIGAIRLVV